jgi:hypothetical protein
MTQKTTQICLSDFRVFVKQNFKSVSNFGTFLKVCRNTATHYANQPQQMSALQIMKVAAHTGTNINDLIQLIQNEYRHKHTSTDGEGRE